jgi:hypothetical protein
MEKIGFIIDITEKREFAGEIAMTDEYNRARLPAQLSPFYLLIFF